MDNYKFQKVLDGYKRFVEYLDDEGEKNIGKAKVKDYFFIRDGRIVSDAIMKKLPQLYQKKILEEWKDAPAKPKKEVEEPRILKKGFGIKRLPKKEVSLERMKELINLYEVGNMTDMKFLRFKEEIKNFNIKLLDKDEVNLWKNMKTISEEVEERSERTRKAGVRPRQGAYDGINISKKKEFIDKAKRAIKEGHLKYDGNANSILKYIENDNSKLVSLNSEQVDYLKKGIEKLKSPKRILKKGFGIKKDPKIDNFERSLLFQDKELYIDYKRVSKGIKIAKKKQMAKSFIYKLEKEKEKLKKEILEIRNELKYYREE